MTTGKQDRRIDNKLNGGEAAQPYHNGQGTHLPAVSFHNISAMSGSGVLREYKFRTGVALPECGSAGSVRTA